jgi:flagellar hook-associated protein 3 FlgL
MTRIATSTMQADAVAAMLRRQSELARTQNDLASGRRIRTPADDPGGAVQVLGLEAALAASERYAANTATAQNRLRFEEQALADVTAALQRVQELALQANNSVLDEPSRRMVATELRSRVEEVLDIANRRDAGGEYLFAGFRTTTQPFARTPSGVGFFGDGGVRLLALSPTQKVADGHSGLDVFADIPEGNGTFTTAAGAANTGTGTIDGGALVDRPAWVSGTYAIRFTSTAAYEVLDATNAQVATGTYVPGSTTTIEFRGIRVAVAGDPAAGDQFTIAPSGREDLFATLDALVTTVGSSLTTGAERARFATEMAGALTQVSQGIDHLLGVRAEVGTRLSAIDSASQAREDLDVELQRTLSGVRNVDYAATVSRLNLQLAGLQAAQQTYARIGRLSLFDYL